MPVPVNLKNKAIETINKLPEKRLKEVVDFIEYLETNKELLEGIKKGIEDLKAGRCRPWRTVRKTVVEIGPRGDVYK